MSPLIQTNLFEDVGSGLSHTAAATKEVVLYLGEPSLGNDEALARTLALLQVTAPQVSQVQRDDRGLALRSV